MEARMTAALTALDIIGGPEGAGGRTEKGFDLVRLVRLGLPVRALQHVIDTGRLTRAEVDSVVLPRKTLANRQKLGTLTQDQSDRLIRVARILAAAEETFGSREKAGAWLRRPTTLLAGDRPLDMLDTD